MNKKQTIRDYQFTFGSPEGKRVLSSLRSLVHLDSGIGTTNPKFENNRQFYCAGQQSVLLHIYKMLTRDPYTETPTRVKESKDVLE
jgi:hypothetical protein